MNDLTFTKTKDLLFTAIDRNHPTVTLETEDLGELLAECEKSNDYTINTYSEWVVFSMGIVVGAIITLSFLGIINLF